MTIKKTITSEVDVELDFSTPKYYKNADGVSRVTDENTLQVSDNFIIAYESEKLGAYYASRIPGFISGEEISETEFNEDFDTVLNKINSLAGISNVPTLQLQEA